MMKKFPYNFLLKQIAEVPSILRDELTYKHFGFSSMKKDEYEEILLKNLIASLLFNLMNNKNYRVLEIFI